MKRKFLHFLIALPLLSPISTNIAKAQVYVSAGFSQDNSGVVKAQCRTWDWSDPKPSNDYLFYDAACEVDDITDNSQITNVKDCNYDLPHLKRGKTAASGNPSGECDIIIKPHPGHTYILKSKHWVWFNLVNLQKQPIPPGCLQEKWVILPLPGQWETLPTTCYSDPDGLWAFFPNSPLHFPNLITANYACKVRKECKATAKGGAPQGIPVDGVPINPSDRNSLKTLAQFWEIADLSAEFTAIDVTTVDRITKTATLFQTQKVELAANVGTDEDTVDWCVSAGSPNCPSEPMPERGTIAPSDRSAVFQAPAQIISTHPSFACAWEDFATWNRDCAQMKLAKLSMYLNTIDSNQQMSRTGEVVSLKNGDHKTFTAVVDTSAAGAPANTLTVDKISWSYAPWTLFPELGHGSSITPTTVGNLAEDSYNYVAPGLNVSANTQLTANATADLRAGGGGEAEPLTATVTISVNQDKLPQEINWDQPIEPQYIDSTIDIPLTATATSGLPVSYATDTEDICGTTSNNEVTLRSPGTCTIQADQAGDDRYAPAPTKYNTFKILQGKKPSDPFGPGQNLSIPSLPALLTVGSPSGMSSMAGLRRGMSDLSFADAASSTTIGRVDVLTDGITGLDFADAGNGTCTVGTTYNADFGCTVNVTFTPTVAGNRYGAIVLTDTFGNVIGTDYFQGTGIGPQVSFLPGIESTVTTSALSYPSGVAVDGSGNVYVADTVNRQVLKETFSAGGYTESTLPIASSAIPTTVTVDGAGNIYVADVGNNVIVKETLSSGSYTESAIPTSPLSYPSGIAVDGSGNLYIADSGNNRVLMETRSGDNYTESTLPTSDLYYPAGVAVDAGGNVYIADTYNQRVLVETLSAGNYTESVVPTSALNYPNGVAVDGFGNIYIADTYSQRVLKETLSSSGYIESTVPTSSLSSPGAVVVAANGNVYVVDTGKNRVLEEDFADPPSLNFALTVPGSTSSDSPQTITVENTGNASLNFSVPSIGNNPNTTANFALNSSGATACPLVSAGSSTVGTLTAGQSCLLPISFTPTAANDFSGAVTLTDNASNAVNPGTPAQQSILLSGTGIGNREQTITFGSISVQSANAVINLVATATSGLPVSFTSITPTICTISESTAKPIVAGTCSIQANQAGSSAYAAAQAVTQSFTVNLATQTITFGAIPTQIANTTVAVALTATASSGLPVSFTSITPERCTVSASSVTLIAAGICTISATQSGNATYAAAPSVHQSFTVTNPSHQSDLNFGSVNIGSTSPATALTLTVGTSGTLGSTSVLTQGAIELDFTNAGNGTCAIGTNYNAGSTCTVNVVFKPTLAGVRYGAVVLTDTSGNIVATNYVQGNGVGPQVNFLPGTESTMATSALSSPYAVAVDGHGNVYIADWGNNRILKETSTVGGYTESTLPTSALSMPISVAVDGSGSVYIADYGNNRVLMETPSAGSYIETTVPTSGLCYPSGVAVDGSGNVYIVDYCNERVLMETLAAGNYVQSTVPMSASAYPTGVAADGNGNVYIVDNANNLVLKETLSAGSYIESTVATSTLGNPKAVKVDGSGNIYIVDSGNNQVLKETLSAGSYTESTIQTSSLSSPGDLAVDGQGNIYIADAGNNRVLKEDLADPPSQSFTPTAPGLTSVDSPHTVTVQNIGNAALNFSIPSSGNNPSIATNFILNSSVASACPLVSAGSSTVGTLAAGQACHLPISFTPTAAGDFTGTLVLTDNAFNAAGPEYTAQTLVLTGTGTGSTAQTISFPVIASQAANTTIILSATASSGLPVSFVSTTPAICTVSASTVSLLASGICSVQANQPGSSVYAAAPTAAQSFTVTPATQIISFIEIHTQVANPSIAVPLTATATSGLQVNFTSITPTICTVSGSSMILITAGTCTIEANQAGDGAFLPAPMVSQNITVKFATPLTGTNVGAVNIGDTSPPMTVTFTFGTAALLGRVSVVTQGATGFDFTDAGGGTCTVGVSYDAGSSCTVNVVFAPVLAGTRYGAVVLRDGSLNVIATNYLQGTGVGPQVNFLPAKEIAVPTSAFYLKAVAADGNGNFYISGVQSVGWFDVEWCVTKETLSPSGGYTESAVPTSTLNSPSGIAVDGGGNLDIVDTWNNRVLKETFSEGSYIETTVPTSVLNHPSGIAVDGGGNIYISDSGNNRVLVETFSAGGYTESTLPTSTLSNPSGVSVDGSGNVYVVDTGNNRVLKETFSSGSYIESVLPINPKYAPISVAVDGRGNVYMPYQYGNNLSRFAVLKETISAGSYTESTMTSSSNNWVTGVAVDGGGNVYVAGLDGMLKEDFADPPSLSFAMTPPGSTSTDSPRTVTVENVGNATLNIPFPNNGTNPSVAANFTLNSSGASSCPLVSAGSSTAAAVAAGQSCLLPISFTPGAAGTFSGTVALTDNALNAAAPRYTAQSIQVSGIGTGAGGVQQTITFLAIPAQAANTTIALTATASSGLPITYSSTTPTICAVSGSEAILLAFGTCTIQANQIGSTVYVPAPMVSQSFAVGDAVPLKSTNFDAVNIGSVSPAIGVAIIFRTTGSLGSVSVLTQGATGLDFADFGAGTCTVGMSYNAGDECTVNVTFTPTAAGNRYGGVVLEDGSGNVIGTSYLKGTGIGPQVNFLPGTESTITSSDFYSYGYYGLGAYGVAVDGNGNVYVVDHYNNQLIKETLSAGNYRWTTIPTSTLNAPEGIAVDGGGNLYIADTYNNRVLKETLSVDGYIETTLPTSVLNQPSGVAVDADGNVYISDSGNKRVLKESLVAYSYIESVVGTCAYSPSGVAVDGSGNVYEIEGAYSVTKFTLSAGSYTPIELSTGNVFPRALAVDGGGNIYVTYRNNTINPAAILKLSLAGGSYTGITLPTSASGDPVGIAVDRLANIYIADYSSYRVLKEDYADPPSLTFALTPPGLTSSDSPQTVTFENIGNATLNFPIPSFGHNPSVGANFTLNEYGASSCPLESPESSTQGTLAAGQSCLLSINFTPTVAGTFSSPLVVIDNALNATAPGYALQSVLLNGTGTGKGGVQQTITFLAIPAQAANTTLALTATASSGLPVTFNSATPAVCTISTSRVALIALGTCTIQVNQVGNATYMPAPTASQSFPVQNTVPPTGTNFGAINIKSSSSVMLVPMTFSSAETLGSISVLTQGAAGLDFANAGVGSCTAGTSYITGGSCTVGVTFTPTRPGSRNGAVLLYDGSGTVIATSFLLGTGVGPQVSFLPGAESTVPTSGLDYPFGVAVDGISNVFIADNWDNRILKETVTAGGYNESIVPTSALNGPLGVAVDGTGNVFVSDTGNNRILKETTTAGGYTESTLPTSALNAPFGIAVDGHGNVYICDSGNNRVLKETPTAGSYAESTVSTSALRGPVGVAVDGNGNVYITSLPGLVKETLSEGSYTESAVRTGAVSFPDNVTVDGNGNLYIAGGSGSSVLKETPSGGSYIESRLPTSTTGLFGVAVDGNGSIYVTTTYNNTVLKEDFADPPSLSFTAAVANSMSSDSPQTITVHNVGNAPLTLPILSNGNNPEISTNFALDTSGASSCPSVSAGSSAEGMLSAGQSCQLAVSFTPTAIGTFSGALVLTDNSLNAAGPAYTAQDIPLSGTGTIQGTTEQSITFGSIPAQNVNTTLSLTATASSGLPVRFTSTTPAICTVSGSSASLIATGTCSIQASQAGSSVYAAAPAVAQSFAINLAVQTISFSALPSAVTYGGTSPMTLSATASSGLAVIFSVSGPATVTGNTLTINGAGSIVVTANQPGNNSYSPAAPVSYTITVAKAVLMVTANNASRAYGTANPTFTDTITGFVNNDTVATSTTGAADLATTATTSSSPGTYTITASVGTLAATNYSFTFVNGSLTVTKAVLTVTANNASRAYGAANPTFTDTITGFVNGDTVATATSGAASLTTTATTSSPLGTYVITAAAGTLRSTKYSFTYVNGTLTVTKAVLTVTANNASRAYGAANPAFTDTITGFVNGDTAATATTGAPSLTTTATTSSATGTYAIAVAAGTLASTNYSFTYVNGTLTVTKAVLTVTANNASRAYGAANPTFTDTITGFVNGDTVATATTGSANLTTTATTSSAPGTYTITVAAGTLAATNYTFTFVNGTLTVTKAALTVTATNASRVYGAANPTFAATITGFLNGDTVSTATTGAASLTTTATTSSAAGSYAITAAAGTLASTKYSFNYVNGTLTVTKAVLTVTANNASRAYGAANPTFTATITGFVNGDTVATATTGAASLTTTATTSSAPGTYTITATAGTLAATNYTFTYVNGTLTVTKAVLTVTANNASRAHGVANPTFTATITGFVNGDTVSTATTGAASLTTTATTSSPAGTYTITAAVGTLASSKYSFVFVNGTLTITP